MLDSRPPGMGMATGSRVLHGPAVWTACTTLFGWCLSRIFAAQRKRHAS